jgi:hypothetical protein
MEDAVVIYSGATPVGMARRAVAGPSGEEDVRQFTLDDVTMVEDDFEMDGPFDLRIRDQLFGPCTISNYRRLRPGFTYDRVVLQGRFKRQVIVEKPKEHEAEKEAG